MKIPDGHKEVVQHSSACTTTTVQAVPARNHNILDDVVIKEQSYDDDHTAFAAKRIRNMVEEG